jgi:hypothetical protein
MRQKKSLRLDTLLPNLIELSVFHDQIVVQQDFESHESRKKLWIYDVVNRSK